MQREHTSAALLLRTKCRELPRKLLNATQRHRVGDTTANFRNPQFPHLPRLTPFPRAAYGITVVNITPNEFEKWGKRGENKNEGKKEEQHAKTAVLARSTLVTRRFPTTKAEHCACEKSP